MDLVHDMGSMDPVHESGPWTRTKEGVHGPLVHVLSSPTKRGIRSLKSVLRSVNRISLVGIRIFSWQEWLYTVCRSVRIERIDKRGIRSVKIFYGP